MDLIRERVFEKRFSGLDEETKKIYMIAEKICRREYEKKFNFDLNKQFGHPQNLVRFSTDDERKQQLIKIMQFWEDTKEKYLIKCSDPLASVIAYLCEIQLTGIYSLL